MATKFLSSTGLLTLIQKIKDKFDSLATVATSGSYSDLSNKPDIGNAKVFYGTCSVTGGTAVKTVTCSEFTSANLVAGALIFVKFTATNSAAVADLKMDVNSTGQKAIKKQYTSQTAQNLNAAGELIANRSYLFTYDGTNWVCMTLDYNSNTTYSGMAIADLRTGTATTNRLISAATLKAAYNINGQVITIGANNITVPVLEISDEYAKSEDLNEDLDLAEGDTYEEAFGKLEKKIEDNELVTTSAIIDLNDKISELSDAEANVLANWNETNSSSDAYILNKPNITQDQYGTYINGANNYVRLSDGHNTIDLDYAGDDGIIINANNGSDGVITIDASSDIYIKGESIFIDTDSGNSSINVTDSGIFLNGNVYLTPIVNHGTSDTTFTLTPNKYHIWGEVSSLTLTLGSGESGYLAEYMFEFQSGSTPTVLTLPNTVEWPATPTIEANKRYLVSIVSNIALMVGV